MWVECETRRPSRGGRRAARFLARPNVHALGWRPQADIARYYQAFDICLIPYQTDHPFNRACNPTKIMDAMGSGRPIVATAIPECRLHAERFHVVTSDDEFAAAVREILAHHSDDGRAGLRHAYALGNTCHGMVERILDLIDAEAWLTLLEFFRPEANGNRRREAVESFAVRCRRAAPDRKRPLLHLF